MKLGLAAFLVVFMFPSFAWSAENHDFFKTYDLEIEGVFSDHIVEDLNNDQQPDIIVMHGTEDKKRMLSIFFQQDGGFGKKADQVWEIDNRIILFDIGNIDEDPEKEIVCVLKDGLYYYKLNGNRYDPALNKMLDIRSIFVVPDKARFPSWNFLRDLNDDDIDDLFIPTFEGYAIYYRDKSGRYSLNSLLTAPLTGEISAVKQSGSNTGDYTNMRYTTSTFLFHDYNRDGRSDIISFDENYLYVYFQDESGGFSSEGEHHKKVDIIENKRGLTISIGTKNKNEQVDISKIADINNDGLLDIIAIKMDTKANMLNPTSQIQIYLGKRSESGQGAVFSKTPDQIIVCEGLQIGIELKDLNGDNYMDLTVPSVKLGVLKIVKILLMRRATLEILIHMSDASGKYSEIPDFKTDFSIEFSYSGGSTIPVHDYNDYNGDGMVDVLASKSSEELDIYFGRSDELLVNKRPDVKFMINLPNNGSAVKPVSLNNDKKMDLIINYSDQDNEKELKKSHIKVLIAG